MKPTLLIADGDAELCDLYKMLLGKCGYEVKIASDGMECLRTLCQVEPAVLLLDQQLGWGGGDGVVAYMREESLMIPVILTTTVDSRRDIADDIEPPVVAKLPKPFAVSSLLEHIRSALADGQKAWRNAKQAPV